MVQETAPTVKQGLREPRGTGMARCRTGAIGWRIPGRTHKC